MNALNLTPMTSQNPLPLSAAVGAPSSSLQPSIKNILKATLDQIASWIQTSQAPLESNLSHMSREEIGQLNRSQILALGQEINAFGPRIDAIGSQIIGIFSAEMFGMIDLGLVPHLNLQYVSGPRIAEVGPAFANAVTSAQIDNSTQTAINIVLYTARENLGQLTLGFLSSFGNAERARFFDGVGSRLLFMTNAQVGPLFTGGVAALLTAEAVSWIPPEILQSLPRSVFQRLNLTEITGAELASLGVIGLLSVDQLSSLTARQLRNFFETQNATATSSLDPIFFSSINMQNFVAALNTLNRFTPDLFQQLLKSLTGTQLNRIFSRLDETTVRAWSVGDRTELITLIGNLPAAIFSMLTSERIGSLGKFWLRRMSAAQLQQLNLTDVDVNTLINAGINVINRLGGPQLLEMSNRTALLLITKFNITNISPEFLGGLHPDALPYLFHNLPPNTFLRLSVAQIAILSPEAINALAADAESGRVIFSLGSPGSFSQIQLFAVFAIPNLIERLNPAAFNVFSRRAFTRLTSNAFGRLTGPQLRVILDNHDLSPAVYGASETGNTEVLSGAQFRAIGAALTGISVAQFLAFSNGLATFTADQRRFLSMNLPVAEVMLTGASNAWTEAQLNRAQQIQGIVIGNERRGARQVVAAKFRITNGNQVTAPILALALLTGGFPTLWDAAFINAIPSDIMLPGFMLAAPQLFDGNANLRTNVLPINELIRIINSSTIPQLEALLGTDLLNATLVQNLINAGQNGIQALIRLVSSSNYPFILSNDQVQRLIAAGTVGLTALQNFSNRGIQGTIFPERFITSNLINSIFNVDPVIGANVLRSFVINRNFDFADNSISSQTLAFMLTKNIGSYTQIFNLIIHSPMAFAAGSFNAPIINFIKKYSRSILFLGIYELNRNALVPNVLSTGEISAIEAINNNNAEQLVNIANNNPNYFLQGIFNANAITSISNYPNGSQAFQNILDNNIAALAQGALPDYWLYPLDNTTLNNIAINNPLALGVGSINQNLIGHLSLPALTNIAQANAMAFADNVITSNIANQLLPTNQITPPLLNILIDNGAAIGANVITSALLVRIRNTNFGAGVDILPIAMLSIIRPQAFQAGSLTSQDIRTIVNSRFNNQYALQTLVDGNLAAIGNNTIDSAVLDFIGSSIPNTYWPLIADIALGNTSAFAAQSISQSWVNRFSSLDNSGQIMLRVMASNPNIFMNAALTTAQRALLLAVNSNNSAIILAMMTSQPSAFFRGMLTLNRVEAIRIISTTNANTLMHFLTQHPEVFAAGSVGSALLEMLNENLNQSDVYGFIKQHTDLLSDEAVLAIPRDFFENIDQATFEQMLGNRNFTANIRPENISLYTGELTRGILQNIMDGNPTILNFLTVTQVQSIEPSDLGIQYDGNGDPVPSSDNLLRPGAIADQVLQEIAPFLSRLTSAQSPRTATLLLGLTTSEGLNQAIAIPNFFENSGINVTLIPENLFTGLSEDAFRTLLASGSLNDLAELQIQQIPPGYLQLLTQDSFLNLVSDPTRNVFVPALSTDQLTALIGNPLVWSTFAAPGTPGNISLDALNALPAARLAEALVGNDIHALSPAQWNALNETQRTTLSADGINASVVNADNRLLGLPSVNAYNVSTMPLIQAMSVVGITDMASSTSLSATTLSVTTSSVSAANLPILIVNHAS